MTSDGATPYCEAMIDRVTISPTNTENMVKTMAATIRPPVTPPAPFAIAQAIPYPTAIATSTKMYPEAAAISPQIRPPNKATANPRARPRPDWILGLGGETGIEAYGPNCGPNCGELGTLEGGAASLCETLVVSSLAVVPPISTPPFRHPWDAR